MTDSRHSIPRRCDCPCFPNLLPGESSISPTRKPDFTA